MIYLCLYLFLTLCVPCASSRQIQLRYDLELISFNSISLVQFCLILYSLIYFKNFISKHFLEVRYAPFDLNLNTKPKKKLCVTNFDLDNIWLIFILIILNDTPYDVTVAWVVHIVPKISPITDYLIVKVFNFRNLLHFMCTFLLMLDVMVTSVSPPTQFLSLVIVYIFCIRITKKVPPWVLIILILLANDIELNPGPPYHENFFTFMNWNLNSIVKNDFERVQLIEAHNSLFNYDLISLCETSLNDSVEIPDPLLNDYTFLSANHPDNVSHGGVGLFYKNSLPLKHRKDLSFDECIVVELKFGRKKYFSQLCIDPRQSNIIHLNLKTF